ncbi:MAG: sigma-70 family RNA polymerase sigma factor [Acidobacteriaceae bacterium]|nr:sigma-70 family RNA polymerase sigma factor [Acidobacteriaceae bacterium]
MNDLPEEEITFLLRAWGNGQDGALENLLPLIHGELRALARRFMQRERPGHTLQTTALLNEAYLRLTRTRDIRWCNRVHFFAVSARIVRRILVDLARSKRDRKRREAECQIALDEQAVVSRERLTEVLAIDEALDRLASLSPRQSQVVELRYFAGLNEIEISEILNISDRTVRQDWNLARAWLHRELSRPGAATHS